jgi:hypothetical protein
MARENRAKREERRFGRPERLAGVVRVSLSLLSEDMR